MSLLLTIMLLSALPFPMLVAIEVVERYKQSCRRPTSDHIGVSAR